MDILILLLVITFLVLAPAIINKKIKRPFPIECPNCKYSGMAKYHTKGNFLTELILWCCLIIPGLIYSIWRLTTRKWVCPQCNYEYVIRLKNGGTKMGEIKENKPFYKKGWFIAIAIIFLLAIIIPAFMEKSNIQNTSSKNENVKPEKPSKTDSEVIKEIEARTKEYQELMKKYYPTKEMLTTLNDYWLKLIIAEETYKNAIEKEQKLIYEKAKALFSVVDRMRRQVYAKLIESEMLDKGFNYEISAQGKNNEILKIKYALMSNALVYNLRNKANLDESAHKLGFKKIIFTDGFDSTWTVDLTK